MSKTHPQLDRVLLDLSELLTSLHENHKYFDVHLVGKNGTIYINVEHEVGTYRLQDSGSATIIQTK